MADDPKLHPRTPAPHTQPVFIWPTPERADLVFWVEKDSRLPKNEAWHFGDKYDDIVKYPNHFLVYVTPEEPGKWAKWYYASNRIAEDAYNWESAVADIGGNKFDAVTRTYLIPRADYNPELPLMGASMPNVPAGKFVAGHVMAEKGQKRTGDQTFDSLFVIETRTYVKKVMLRSYVSKEDGKIVHEDDTLYYRGEVVPPTNMKVEDLFADTGNGFWGLQSNGSTNTGKQLSENWFLITNSAIGGGGSGGSGGTGVHAHMPPVYIWPTPEEQDLVFWVAKNGHLPENQGWQYGEPYKGPENFPNHFLVYVAPEDSDKWSKWYYASKRIDEDKYNWESTFADIGGTKFDTVTRTYLTLRSDFKPLVPKMGDTLPNDPAGLFPSGFVMAERQQKRSGDEIFDSMFVIDIQTYVKRVTIRSLGVDQLNGKSLYADDTFWYLGEVVPGTGGKTVEALFALPTEPYWGLQDDGTQRSGKRLSANWWLITNEQVVAGTFAGGVVEIDTFTTNDNYSWPAVLGQIDLLTWAKRNGGVDIFPMVKFTHEAYNGPCLTTIMRGWSKVPFLIPQASKMEPLPIHYSAPFFSLNVPDCLHLDVEVHCDIGTSDPDYKQNVNSSVTFDATLPSDWPPTIVAYDDQTNFRGGYLRTTRVVSAPISTFTAPPVPP